MHQSKQNFKKKGKKSGKSNREKGQEDLQGGVSEREKRA
jgi:hypothetical protein